MALSAEEVADRYPIHWLVWNDQHEELQKALECKKFNSENIEMRDPRGRTPLLLAVTLGHIESVRVLLDAGADVNCEKDGWTAVQEATATGDIDLLSLVLSRRDHQRYLFRSRGIPDLLNRLSLAPDFYVEMKWEFTSWMPLISRVCPSDTYKVYKRGANVRVDTTLIGFENRSWLRGDISYVFKGQGTSAKFMEVNHEAGTVATEEIDGTDLWPHPVPRPRALRRRMGEPLAINYLDTDKISFERNKSGIWGWRQDKSEVVNGYECKVFSANNVEIVSKTRCEHLPAGARRSRPPPIAGLLRLPGDTPAADLDLSQQLKSRHGVAWKHGVGRIDRKVKYDIEEGPIDSNQGGPSSEIHEYKELTTKTATKEHATNTNFKKDITNLDSKERTTDFVGEEHVKSAAKKQIDMKNDIKQGNESNHAGPSSEIHESTKEHTIELATKEHATNTDFKEDTTNLDAKERTTDSVGEKHVKSAAKKQTDMKHDIKEAYDSNDAGPSSEIHESKEFTTKPATKEHATNTDFKEDTTNLDAKEEATDTDVIEHTTNAAGKKHVKYAAKKQTDDAKPITDCSKKLSSSHSQNRSKNIAPKKNDPPATDINAMPTDAKGNASTSAKENAIKQSITTAKGKTTISSAVARVNTLSESTSGYVQQLGGDSTGKPPATVWHFRREKDVTYDKMLPPDVFESSDDEDDGHDVTPAPLEEEDSSSGSEEPLVAPTPVTWEEYFSGEPLRADIGRPKDMTTKVQRFKATLSLCEDYPLELQEQIMPILDLMTAIASPHFAKLKDFIQMQLPSGFPVKIEIPLFHVMNARITFGNIFGTESAVPLVETIQEGDRLSCVIDDQCFDIGRGYKDAGSDDRLGCEDGEEGLLQYAIQQSLMEAGTHEDQVDVWEALRGARPATPAEARAPRDLLASEQAQLQRAIEASLATLSLNPGEAPVLPDVGVGVGVGESDVDEDLQAALALSVEEQSAINEQLAAEQRALDEALRISLLDK